MRIFLPPLEVSDTDGFTKDLFNREAIGKGLTNVVSTVMDPMVIAVDGQWGSGKTTFLKMWAGSLRKAGFPVVYFDAFEQDYVEDAFTAIAGEIIALAQEKKKAQTPLAEKFVNKAVDAGKVILRSGLKLGVKLATVGALEAADLTEVAEDISKEASEIEDEYLGELLTKQQEQKDAIQSFREALSELPKLLAGEAGGQSDVQPKPLIIIVDELDRCRPIFALQILERIKHFFAVPGVHFVLGAHIAQLCNSVKVAYGSEINPHLYLQKFIHLTLHLVDSARYEHERISTKYINHLIEKMELSADQLHAEYAKKYIHHMAEQTNLSLRTIERIVSTLAIALAFKSDSFYSPPAIVVGLCFLKVINPDLYVRAKMGGAQWENVKGPLGFGYNSQEQDKSVVSHMAQHWRYCTDANLRGDELDDKWGRGLFEYHLEKHDVVAYVANNVIDRLTRI